MQVCGDMSGSLRLDPWKDIVLHVSTGSPGSPSWAQVVLPVFAYICPTLLIVWNSMPVIGQVVILQGQHTKTMMAVGLPQKGNVPCPRPYESQISSAQSKAQAKPRAP